MQGAKQMKIGTGFEQITQVRSGSVPGVVGAPRLRPIVPYSGIFRVHKLFVTIAEGGEGFVGQAGVVNIQYLWS
jgi:hypothetical protein